MGMSSPPVPLTVLPMVDPADVLQMEIPIIPDIQPGSTTPQNPILKNWLATNYGVVDSDVLRIHEETNFKVNFAGFTKPNEFEYTHGGKVAANMSYHIHYTNSKEEVFMTGPAHTSSSKIIKKLNGNTTMLSQYSNLKTSIKQDYPTKKPPSPTDTDYKLGTFTRYFTQHINNIKDELFEISEDDFNNENTLFRYVSLKWTISGIKSDVIRKNINVIRDALTTPGNKMLNKILYPLQFWLPNPDSKDSLYRRLGRIKLFGPPPPPLPPLHAPPIDWSLVNPNRWEQDDDTNPLQGRANRPTNIVYDDDGNALIGFINGTRVDMSGGEAAAMAWWEANVNGSQSGP
jgi:hypothetical protein